MKFTDGNWMLQPGLKAHYPTQAYDVAFVDDTLVAHATTRRVRHRADTLSGPLLTISLSSPLQGVIKVSVEHFSGKAGKVPSIPLAPLEPPKIEYSISDSEATFSSGALVARIERKRDWELSFSADGKLLTKSGYRGMGYIDYGSMGRFIHEQLSLEAGEYVYGLGERFTAFVKNGQVVENWNKDGGTSSDQAYKSVPFYLSNRGYGVLVNETGPVSFEVASEKVGRVQFSIPGERIEYFIICGPTPKQVLERLTTLTGKPALPPAWSFGLWLTTSFTTDYDEETCLSFIDGMAKRELPLHVFHFDCFWMREFNWCDFEWDTRVFPDPQGMLARLKERGLRVSVWINPYIAQRSPLFKEAAQRGLLLTTADGSVWQTDQWQPGMAIVDFTNPEAADWYASKLRRLAELGVDSFKTDFGERIPTDVVYHDGSDPVAMHNFYPILYNQVAFTVLEELKGKGQAVLFARASYASGQRLPVHWGGDCDSSFASMAESLRGGLSLSLCGFGYWSHDIGGFEGHPPESLYKRWIAFGLLSSHSRLHGSHSYRVPWQYGEEACDTLRFFTRLKCRLMPYLYAKAVEAHRNGIPMMRAMIIEFPDDPGCDTLERQYMLGDALLVAPVFSEDNISTFYLPPGRWTHLLTEEVTLGGAWRKEAHGFLSLPVYVRENVLLPIGCVETKPDYDYPRGCVIKLFQLQEGAQASTVVTDQKGESALELVAQRRGSTITVSWQGEAANWKLQLVGTHRLTTHHGATTESHTSGVVVTPNFPSQSVTLTLQH